MPPTGSEQAQRRAKLSYALLQDVSGRRPLTQMSMQSPPQHSGDVQMLGPTSYAHPTTFEQFVPAPACWRASSVALSFRTSARIDLRAHLPPMRSHAASHDAPSRPSTHFSSRRLPAAPDAASTTVSMTSAVGCTQSLKSKTRRDRVAPRRSESRRTRHPRLSEARRWQQVAAPTNDKIQPTRGDAGAVPAQPTGPSGPQPTVARHPVEQVCACAAGPAPDWASHLAARRGWRRGREAHRSPRT